MAIDIIYYESLGFKDIGLHVITDNYINQIRIRHWILCAVDTLSLILASYLIIKKSSKEMKSFKWFLLNISVSRTYSFWLNLHRKSHPTLYFREKRGHPDIT